MRPRERSHRLPEAAYYGKKAVSFTACVERRRRILNDPTLANAFVALLTHAADKHHCIVPVYCLMPDHMHVIVYGLEDRSRPKWAMESFKNDSGKWFSEHRPGEAWQKDFHDHALRKSKGYAAMVRYIAANPVRAGLAPDIDAWPYSGSLGCSLDEVLLDAFWE